VSSRARELFAVVSAFAAAAGGSYLDGSPIQEPGPRRRESIDDVLARARARKGKAWWQPSLGGSPARGANGAPVIFTGSVGSDSR
jgi:hypothetical protein